MTLYRRAGASVCMVCANEGCLDCPDTYDYCPVEEPVYRIDKVPFVQGDMYVMQGRTYLGRLVEFGGNE